MKQKSNELGLKNGNGSSKTMSCGSTSSAAAAASRCVTAVITMKMYNICYQFHVPRNLRIDIKDVRYIQSVLNKTQLVGPFGDHWYVINTVHCIPPKAFLGGHPSV